MHALHYARMKLFAYVAGRNVALPRKRVRGSLQTKLRGRRCLRHACDRPQLVAKAMYGSSYGKNTLRVCVTMPFAIGLLFPVL